ncbi:MAG: bifunctional hydroxymethylpyrimidine kinase/phosphomethylpyrimidine kinase, partial [Bacteroidota bacterium]
RHKPAIYRKGGHQEGAQAIDRILIGKTAIELSAERLPIRKHGSGCVLSAALCSALAEGLDLTTACMRARAYTRTFLTSNESLLGYHAYAEKTS